MEQTYVVAGYFASRAAVGRALRLINLDTHQYEIFEFGHSAPTKPLIALALAWLRPDEWLLVAHQPLPAARQTLDLLQRSGETLQAALLSPELLWQPGTTDHAPLKERWRYSLGIIQTLLSQQIAQNERGGMMQQAAKWGITEAAYENNLAGISLIEHRYIIDGYIERLDELVLKSRGLVKLPTGQVNGVRVPFVYELAVEAEHHLKGRLTEARLKRWLGARCRRLDLLRSEYQTIEPMLVVTLMEDLAGQVAMEQRREAEVRLARLAAARIGDVPSGELEAYWHHLRQVMPRPSTGVALLILELVRESEEQQAGLARLWDLPVAESLSLRLRRLQREDAERLESFNRIVTSLRLMTRLDWELLVEDINPVIAILRRDPSEYFVRMDSPTRTHYADRVADLAKWSGKSERTVAAALIERATMGEGVARHIGYYLRDEGRAAFIRALRARRPWDVALVELVRRWPASWYLGLLGLVTLVFMTGLAWLVGAVVPGASFAMVAAILVMALLPVSQVALEITVYGLMRLVQPEILPKLRFPRDIPRDYHSLVVVPLLLRDGESASSELERLETRYLANCDPGLSYGLLTDFTDAPAEQLATDEAVVSAAMAGLRQLQERYPGSHFFLYHRPRTFNASEGVWMGAERKRGKLEDFNNFVVGHGRSEWLLVGDAQRIQAARFIITLDEDTELPPGAAKRMVEAMAHPLNVPQLAPSGRRLARGYGIIQPRVSTGLESGRVSRLSRLFNSRLGIDPYLVSYSDLYYDLARDAIFHGKGIYDPRVFDAVLGERLPNNRILSHDLLEGSYVRVALATDIVLFDTFPSTHHGLLSRQHRWIRGDWQVGAWARRFVPGVKGVERTPLSAINRWKVADNLRRSVLPIAQTALLVVGLIAGDGIQMAVFGLVGLAIFIPTMLRIWTTLLGLLHLRRPDITALMGGIIDDCYQLMMLPRLAWLSVDAIGLALYRLGVSRRHLLQWQTASDMGRRGRRIDGPSAVISVVALASLIGGGSSVGLSGSILLAVWVLAPLMMLWLDRIGETRPVSEELDTDDRAMLRRVALQTWRFFDELMTKDNNYLPPDNLQVTLKLEVARRTSPTNIGLGILAWQAARDLGYISIDQLLDRLEPTFDAIERLEKYRGHIFNWYRTDTLEPLLPRYVSMVDSGNLMASLWAFRQGIVELSGAPLATPEVALGWHELVEGVVRRVPRVPETVLLELQTLTQKLLADRDDPSALITSLGAITTVVQARATELREAVGEPSNFLVERLIHQAEVWQGVIESYLTSFQMLSEPPAEVARLFSAEFEHRRQGWLATVPSLTQLAALAAESRLIMGEADPVMKWWSRVERERRLATSRAMAACTRLDELAHRAGELADATDMKFLYEAKRKAFHIGYNLEERTLDASFYDLLASEARLGSFTAIAAGQVPAEHWWSLGRNSRRCDNRPVLLSWSGTMFEYLMPRLLMRDYPDTLLQQGIRAAVDIQRRYGRQLEIPWGISESGHSALDYDNTYQYRAFGTPVLGIQSGLEQGVVVAPYASMLALAVAPAAAVANLRQLERQGLRGDMGFFEAVDYRRAATASGERGVGVFSYMAHHQAMGLLAIANILGGDRFPERFHRDLRVSAARTLLHERAASPGKSRQDTSLRRVRPLRALTASPVVEGTASLTAPLPPTHTLTNGTYSVMVTATGSGFSRWGQVEINRWSADALGEERGSYVYVRDVVSDAAWSTTFGPTFKNDESYRVSFMPEKAVFERVYEAISTREEVYVAPDHDVEVRWLRVRNNSASTRKLELTSVLEFGMAPHEAQAAHPAFNKLFIGVEPWAEQDGILAHRRPRAATDAPVWVAHLLVNLTRPASRATLQADRETFVGRGSTIRRPAGLGVRGEAMPAYPLDPIAAVTQRLPLAAGAVVELAALTITAASRREVMRLANRYRQRSHLIRARQGAWTLRQAELQRLQVTESEAQIFQNLAPYLLYPNRYLKAPARGLVAGGENISVTYADLPQGPSIVVAIDDMSDLVLARQLGLAQKYFNVRGLHYPLVWLVKLSGEAGLRLRRQLEELAESLKWLGEAEPGVDIRIWSLGHMSDELLQELTSRARVVLDGTDGPLWQQLSTVTPLTRGIERPELLAAAPAMLALPEHIEYPNGLGAFVDGGRGYTMLVTADMVTPAPWANVLANARFGSLITERGGGFTWSANSQQYRLTPWQNEPLTDKPTELIYIHDLQTNTVWSPQPGYHATGAAVVTHRPGETRIEGAYDGLQYRLTSFVPVGWRGPSTVRVQRLRITNTGNRSRLLRLTSYAEWVLGAGRDHTQEQVVTGWDDGEQMVTAVNPAHPDYGQTVAYMAQNRTVVDFTTDRAEFLGPVRGDELPHGLGTAELTGRIGVGVDPVAVMRSEAEVAPGAEVEIDCYLGTASSPQAAVAAVRTLREAGSVTAALAVTADWWEQTLSVVTVESPAREADILMNTWLPYQTLSGRIWGRTGYYQSSGAFGFRDQLQDSLALVYARPEVTRKLILQAAAHQYREGDVQHWWMPDTTRGLRTRMTDDRLWLGFVVTRYLAITGDNTILEEEIPYLESAPLPAGVMEDYHEAIVSAEIGTLLDHCCQAVAISLTKGAHGLPLMGSGDWNDGLNRVGIGGQGESVWLGWFQVVALREMADLLDQLGRSPKRAEQWRQWAQAYTAAIEAEAWDGDWYVRAFYDDGQALGGANSTEARIDSLAQSWAVLAGTGSLERRTRAIDAAMHQLVDREHGVVNLLTPPFDHAPRDPGYIKGYLPGTRENGGQYTHGSLWLAQALAHMGRGDDAVELLRLMNPINHSLTTAAAQRYALEPYVTAGDVYSLAGQEGRGGWSWYTGSSAWMYRIWLEDVFGFKLRGSHLEIDPCIDRNWPGFTLTYRYHSAVYEIEVTNPHHVCRGVAEQVLDDQIVPRGSIKLMDDGRTHHLVIRLGY